MTRLRVVASIGASAGHTHYHVREKDGRTFYRCACGRTFTTRQQLALHHNLERMLAP